MMYLATWGTQATLLEADSDAEAHEDAWMALALRCEDRGLVLPDVAEVRVRPATAADVAAFEVDA